MADYLATHRDFLLWLGGISVVMFIGSLLLVPVLVVRMRDDYFLPTRDDTETVLGRHPVALWTGRVLKNLLGIALLGAGIAMLVLPGQGLLTILLGLALVSFPGKRRLERRMVQLPGVLRTINRLRTRFGRPPLDLPPA